MNALGGRRGLVDTGVPGAIFVAVYAPWQHMAPALWAAVGVAAALTVVRLVRRETLQYALGGFFAVVVAALVARQTGRAADYFLPTILKNIAYLAGILISLAVRWPFVGLVVGAATGDLTGWRKNPTRLRAFTWVTWFWAGMFAIRLGVQLPLWLTDRTGWLGMAGVVLGYPLFALVLFLSYFVVKQLPPARTAPSESGG